uniref:Uncharacterized protein n=1 Tax=Acrobeloides nanus TaxID=290746 RepID=A0A914EJA5_9BILA
MKDFSSTFYTVFFIASVVGDIELIIIYLFFFNYCIKKDAWPASSPDLNPLDYSIWSLLEADVNAEEHNSVESLKNAISEAFERLPIEVINQAVDNWMKRLDAVIKAKGRHFE